MKPIIQDTGPPTCAPPPDPPPYGKPVEERSVCVNGCEKAICPPSKALCKECLDELGKMIRRIASRFSSGEPKEESHERRA